MKRYEVSCDDGEAFEMENGRFYLASDVDALLERIDVEARQQSAFTMANIRRLITRARLGVTETGDLDGR